MMATKSLVLLTAAAFTLASPLSTSHDVPVIRGGPRAQPIAILNRPGVVPHQIINDSYIVMFKDGVHPASFDNHFNFLSQAHEADPLDHEDAGLTHIWDAHIKGYAGRFSRDVVELIRRQPEVDYIEHDQIVHTLETQKTAPWVCVPPLYLIFPSGSR